MIYGTPEFDEVMLDILKEGYRHPSYEESVKHAEEMSWHFFGTTPSALLDSVRPNEDPDITQYRKDNYQPITKSAADKAIKITSKIFNPNLSSIRWEKPSTQGEELKKYTLEDYPIYNSLPNYMKDVVLRKMLADPNGVLVATLDEIPESETQTPEPLLKIYGSKNIFDFDEDHYLINTGVHQEKDSGDVYTFCYYDRTQFIEFDVYYKNKELFYTELDRYQYDFPQIPVWPLGGMSEALDDGSIILKSFYSSAAPHWNNAITHESDLFAAYIKHLHPQKYEIAEVCDYKMEMDGIMYGCRGGRIKWPKGLIDCPHCSGSGFNPIGPYGVYKFTKEKLSEGGPMGIDPVGYINIPVEATKMLEERTDKSINKGLWAINMEVEDTVGENQSGVAKVIDRSAQYDTLYDIGSVIYDVHITNAYFFFNLYKYGVANRSVGKPGDTESNLPQVNKPTQFDIASVSELINNFKAAKESGLDPNYMQMKQIEIQTRDMSTNPDLKRFTSLLLELDPLPGMAVADINTNVMRGFVSKNDAVIHFNLKAFVERAMRENKDFISMDKEKQLEILNSYADEFVKANKPAIDTTQIPGFNAA